MSGPRPVGSVSLTRDIEATILSYVRAGAFDHVAAEAAGISARTFQDWISRGEGRHPTRSPTARLRAFAEAVRRAKAEVRLAAEARVYREQPAYWLSRVARTTPDREGWTEPPKGGPVSPEDGAALADPAELEQLERMVAAMVALGDPALPPCPHPRCRCPYHRRSR